jgi:type I restriction enzyme S subunit
LASIHYSAYEFDAEKIDIDYLKWFLKSNIFRKLLLKQTESGIKKEIKAKHLLPIEIQLPSLNWQHEIVRQIQGVANYIEEVNRQIQQQAEYAEMLRQSILQQAVEGKLCEQDPKDEPASVLLEKIKAEKERLIAEKKIKKQKPLLPISEEEKPFDLPKGWKWCRLGDILIANEYGTSQKADDLNGSIPVLRMNNIKSNGEMCYSNLKYVGTNIKDLPKLYLEKGDILFNRTNSYDLVGKTGLFEENSRYTFASYLIRLRIYGISNRYVHLCMNSNYYRTTQIEPYIVQQNGQANYNGTKVASTLIPIPPLKEQNKIVLKVYSLMQLYNALEEEIQNAKKYASQLMGSVLQEAFSVQEAAKSAQIIEFHPDQITPETELLAAARGKIREDTWEHLCKRALEIAGEES